MNRRKFLKYLGLGTAATAVGTFLLEHPEKVLIEPTPILESDIGVGDGWIKQIEDRGVIHPWRHTGSDELEKAMKDMYKRQDLLFKKNKNNNSFNGRSKHLR